MAYEYTNCDKIKSGRMGFNMEYSLKDMIKPENIKKIKENYQKGLEKRQKHSKLNIVHNLFKEFINEDDLSACSCYKFAHF